ncbi:hypothetical protein CEUSTIGMA_g7530.t1 [Chlamydomonas eustigma]|uniref:GATA-type domain-containing protein n=1 Tax=Chlamydomonas eustigma TaxID=1157962 RepID=A0A250XB40_9CHLO|nr:hypothetical protein CEUSTIGMA_g7530.t1 [Chlamydomonas eustigma]|eukprot:GAX80092.1 hypothetical protein CEUSTIGMA_g7530.t1 [Chlamydomonas eustigma]
MKHSLTTDVSGVLHKWSDDEDKVLSNQRQPLLSCCQCGASQTPQWREGPLGPKTLCNACGVKYYRMTKRSRKLGSGSTSKATKTPKRDLPLKFSATVTGDSGDETCAPSINSEESEEHVAALSLLSFAQLQPAGTDRNNQTCHFFSNITLHAMEELTMEAPVQLLPAQDIAVLHGMQADVQQAYKELQAAEAATIAVAQFLSEKRELATVARARAQTAAQMLLEEMRSLEAQYQLSKALATSPEAATGQV